MLSQYEFESEIYNWNLFNYNTNSFLELSIESLIASQLYATQFETIDTSPH